MFSRIYSKLFNIRIFNEALYDFGCCIIYMLLNEQCSLMPLKKSSLKNSNKIILIKKFSTIFYCLVVLWVTSALSFFAYIIPNMDDLPIWNNHTPKYINDGIACSCERQLFQLIAHKSKTSILLCNEDLFHSLNSVKWLWNKILEENKETISFLF